MNKTKNKWVVSAASAALVASAIVPVASAASFSDIENNTHKDAILALAEAGIISGYTDGTFKPNAEVTRGNVTKLLGKWLVSEGYEIPEDYNTVERFTDLPVNSADEELVKYAALVKDEGVFKGSNNKLMQADKMSREQMAVVLVRALKTVYNVDLVADYKAADFESKLTDLDKANAEENRDAIIALEYAEITKVANGLFNPKNTVTRGQFASFLHRAIENVGLTVKTVTVKDATTLEVTLSDDSVHTVTLKEALPENKETKVEFEIDGKTYSATVTYEVLEAKVESVTAINAKQVQVKFTQAVDKTDATTNPAYKVAVQGVTFTGTPELSEDGKVLTLTATAPIDVKEAAVTVEQIKTKADANEKTEKYVGKMTYKDEVAPTIVSVEAKTNGNIAKEIEVKVSEPLKADTGLVKVNGAYANATIDGTDTIKVTGLSLEAGKTHTVELINIEDEAGNKVVSTKADFTVTVDAAAPTATLSAHGDKQILVTFNKKMDVNSVKAGLADGAVKDEALAAVQTGAVTEVKDSKGTQFIIPVNTTLYTNKTSRTLNVVFKDSIVDSLGNKVTATTQAVTLTKDTVKPVATGYKVVTEGDKVKAIEVTFSEGLKAANAGTIAFGSVVDTNGVLDSNTFADFQSKAVLDGDKKVVFEIAKAKEIKGKYAISFAKELVTDLSEVGNKSEAFNYTIDFGTSTTETQFEIDNANKPAAVGNVITVTFPEAVKGGAVANSATDISNYSLAGKPLPTGTTITLEPGQTVAKITLPATESIEKDDQAAVFTVANIKNTAGTKTLKTYTGTIEVKDNTAPVLQSAKVLDNKTIELTYSENIQLEGGNNVGDSFKILQGTESLLLANDQLTATVASGFENKLVLKIAKTTSNGTTTPASATVSAQSNKDGATTTVTGTYTGKTDKTIMVKVETVDQSSPKNVETWSISYDNGANWSVAGTETDLKDGLTLGSFTAGTADAVVGDTFTITAKAATTATTTETTLDLTKDITIETLEAASKVVVDKSSAKNQQKKEVKVTVVKP